MLLELLAKGATEQEILEDYPQLETDDIRTTFIYAHCMVATKDFNLKLGKNLESVGQKIVYIKIKNLRPKILSRIKNVSLSLQISG